MKVLPAPKASRRSSRVTLRDVAARAGVNHMAVSVTLNGTRGKTGVSTDTRERILRAAEELGYQANPIAQSLMTGRTGIVGLWLGDMETPFATHLMQSLHARAQSAGFDVQISNLSHERVRDPAALEQLVRWPLDGVIIFGPPQWVEILRQLPDRHSDATVSVGWHPVEGLDNVWWDLRPGAEEAIEHLVKAGYRSIGYVAGPWGFQESDLRFRAYSQAMAAAGLETHSIQLPGEKRTDALHTLRRRLREEPALDALYCYNDDFAIAARSILHELGKEVPKEVGLTGCDGLLEGLYMAPPLSTVHVPVEDISNRAWELLRRRMQDPESPLICDRVEAHFQPRGST